MKPKVCRKEAQPLDLRETDLPGIGRKISLNTRSGDHLIIVAHNDERRDLFHMDEQDPDEMKSVITLEEDEAQAVAAIIGGISYQPRSLETREIVLDGLLIEWLRLDPASRCIGRTIGELDIRRKTGATVIAVVERSKDKHINPGSKFVLTAGATLVLAGERMQLKQLKQLLGNGSL